MTIVTREALGRPLTWQEMDGNFKDVETLSSAAESAVATATNQAQAASSFAQQAAQSAASAEQTVTEVNENLDLLISNAREQWSREMTAAGLTLVNGSFEEGGTVTSSTDVLWYKNGAQGYIWNGTFPKTVTADDTPDLTGWTSVVGNTLKVNLAKPSGSSTIGYVNPVSNLNLTVQQAFDKINVRLIYATDFGVKVDGSDNADALFRLGNFISSSSEPLHVIFPSGTSLVGSQQLAGATGKNYSYRPGYSTFAWADASDMGWFSVHRTNTAITLDMSNWVLKMNPGMKIGSFDPTTGAPYTPSSLPFYQYDYQASQGYLIKIYKAPRVRIIGGTTDGNVANVNWGGNFGDTGYQVPAYNIWFNQCSGVYVENHRAINSPLDAFYVGETGDSFSPGDTQQIKGSYFKRCVLQDCGRNILSYTGGANAVFEDCEFWRAGNNASGINGHGSGPASCIDVESEGGKILNLKFKRCKMMHGGDVAVVGGFAVPNDITNVMFDECIMHCETGTQAFINYARNCTVVDCTIIGGISLDTGTKQNPTRLIRCMFYNRVDGKYIRNFALSGISDFIEDCTVYYEIPDTALPDMVVFNLRGFQQLSGGYGNRATISNLTIFISGNSNNITHTDLGGFTYYRGVTAHIEASGITGSKTLAVYMLDSTAGFEGLSVGGSALITYGGTMVNQPSTGIYYDVSVPTRTGGVIQPAFDGSHGLGKKGSSFKQVYSTLGMLTQSPNGTQYRLRVNDSGQPYAVADNT